MTSYVKLFGNYLIKVPRKSLREVKLQQKDDMSSVLNPIAANKVCIMSDENLMTLCTASHSCSETAPSLS